MKFENKENRLEYLDQKLDDLLSGINATYGQDLLDELVIRLQRTIVDFNEEVEKIMGNLKDNSEKKNQMKFGIAAHKAITTYFNDFDVCNLSKRNIL